MGTTRYEVCLNCHKVCLGTCLQLGGNLEICRRISKLINISLELIMPNEISGGKLSCYFECRAIRQTWSMYLNSIMPPRHPLHIQFNSIKRFTDRVHMHKNSYFISKVIKALVRVHKRRAHISHTYIFVCGCYLCAIYTEMKWMLYRIVIWRISE